MIVDHMTTGLMSCNVELISCSVRDHGHADNILRMTVGIKTQIYMGIIHDKMATDMNNKKMDPLTYFKLSVEIPRDTPEANLMKNT